MLIGIDFDNTIACYDGVFHAAALERGLIPPDIATDKTSVRNHLRNVGREPDWTELQGYVYGARMDLVLPYPDVLDFVAQARAAGHDIAIVSHKTQHPFMGPPYDLHAAARGFLAAQRFDVPAHFELTLPEKIARIAALRCDAFIDDLPELLAEPDFPQPTRAILFDPDGHAPDGTWKGHRFERHGDWRSIAHALLA